MKYELVTAVTLTSDEVMVASIAVEAQANLFTAYKLKAEADGDADGAEYWAAEVARLAGALEKLRGVQWQTRYKKGA